MVGGEIRGTYMHISIAHGYGQWCGEGLGGRVVEGVNGGKNKGDIHKTFTNQDKF